jgi:hypothetical protein
VKGQIKPKDAPNCIMKLVVTCNANGSYYIYKHKTILVASNVVTLTNTLIMFYPPLALFRVLVFFAVLFQCCLYKSYFHFGHWCCRQAVPFRTACTKKGGFAVNQWTKENKRIWIVCLLHLVLLILQTVEDTFKWMDPALHAAYVEQILKFHILKFFCCFYSCALNIGWAATPHVDGKDYKKGYCWDIPYGKYLNGMLQILSIFIDEKYYDMGLSFVVPSGSTIAFRSHYLKHSVQEFSGTRNSIVLFTHDVIQERSHKTRKEKKTNVLMIPTCRYTQSYMLCNWL